MPFTKRTFKKRTFKKFKPRSAKRTFKRRSKNKIITSKEKNLIMSDNKMVKFDYIMLTNALPFGTVTPYSNHLVDGVGGIPFNFGTTNTANVVTDLITFSPQYNVVDTTNLLQSIRLIPGNSLIYCNQTLPSTTQQSFSDKFRQTQPLGVQQWYAFYNKYICHGSAIEVTLVDASVPGQLCVIPVCTQGAASQAQVYDYYPGSGFPANINSICKFETIVDDNPHAKVKLVSPAGGMDKVKIKHKMLTKQLYDVKNLKDDDLNKGTMPFAAALGDGNFVNNPQVNQWAWQVLFLPVLPVPAGTDNIVQVQIKVTYFCELTDRSQLNYVSNS